MVRTPGMCRNRQPRGAQRLVGLASCVRAITSTFVQQIRMLCVDDVMHFESDTQGMRVVADDCDGLIRSHLKEAILDSVPSGNFLQTHRSTVVDRRFVRDLHRKSDRVGLELKQRLSGWPAG